MMQKGKKIIWLLILLLLFGCVQSNNIKPEPTPLPKQTPLVNNTVDENGVILSHMDDGKSVYNIYKVAMQAMEGAKTFDQSLAELKQKGLIPRFPEETKEDELEPF